MDSVNLSETQSTPFNCKNTASNTGPVSCVCCGSKDYMQAFPQAYCFTPLYPGISKCKHFQESFEENFKFQQPFFPSPPLFHPFFHNIAIPPNFYWAQNHGDNKAVNKQQNQTSEPETIQTSSDSCTSCSQQRNDFKSDETAFDEAKKQNNRFAPQNPFLGNPFNMSNFVESQISSFFQRFACDSSIPWPCSPFIAPMISYCLLWNSQKPTAKASPENYTRDIPETLNKNDNENSGSQKFSNHDSNKPLPNTTDIIGNTNNNLTEKNSCSQEGGLEIYQQVESDDQNSGKFSTFLSLNSFNSFKHIEKEDHNRSTEIFAGEEGEDTEIEGFDFEDQEESDECLKSAQKNLSNKNSNPYFLLDSNYNVKENECQSPLGSPSYTNLKEKKNDINTKNVLSGEDISAKEEKCLNTLQDSDDEREKTTPLDTASGFKEQMPFKKFIKNFTMTDQTNSLTLKEEQISVAAAGDLGGENCVGYKTDISSFEEDQEGKEKILLKGLKNLDEKKSDSFFEKGVNERLKNDCTVKTSIAKLSKSKDSKSDSVKNIKQNKEFSQKDIGIMKRKHNCFPPDSNAVTVPDKNTKIQKTKNFTPVQQHFTGPEKQQKEYNNRIQTLKKEEKSLATKARPLYVTQKTIKNTCRK